MAQSLSKVLNFLEFPRACWRSKIKFLGAFSLALSSSDNCHMLISSVICNQSSVQLKELWLSDRCFSAFWRRDWRRLTKRFALFVLLTARPSCFNFKMTNETEKREDGTEPLGGAPHQFAIRHFQMRGFSRARQGRYNVQKHMTEAINPWLSRRTLPNPIGGLVGLRTLGLHFLILLLFFQHTSPSPSTIVINWHIKPDT